MARFKNSVIKNSFKIKNWELTRAPVAEWQTRKV